MEDQKPPSNQGDFRQKQHFENLSAAVHLTTYVCFNPKTLVISQVTSIVLEDSIQMGGSTISRGGGGCWHATHFALAQRWCRQGLWFEPGWTDGCADAAATQHETGADCRSNGDVSLPL